MFVKGEECVNSILRRIAKEFTLHEFIFTLTRPQLSCDWPTKKKLSLSDWSVSESHSVSLATDPQLASMVLLKWFPLCEYMHIKMYLVF